MQSYVASAAPGTQRKSQREQLTRKIAEQEAAGKTLRERQKVLKDTHTPGLSQLTIWRDLERLLAAKARCRAEDGGAAPGESDRLVL